MPRIMLTFTKMHGLGNDFVVLDCMDGAVHDFCRLALRLCDRHLGVGADGLIAILPSDMADCRMRIFNSDGTEAQMCGNGIRCVGKYVRDSAYVVADSLSVETLSGIKHLALEAGADGKIESVTVDMGLPRLIESVLPGDMAAVSVGNPHIVKFVNGVAEYPVAHEGPVLEHHPVWRERANVEFVEISDAGTLEQRTWERGVGETQACGTGACAAAFAAVSTGRGNYPITVRLLGGELLVDTDAKTGHLLMTGPAVEVFRGVIPPCAGTSSGSL